MSERDEIQVEKSYLEGKPTSFKGASFHGANFDNIKNITGARLPTGSDLKELPKEGEKTGILGGLFSKK